MSGLGKLVFTRPPSPLPAPGLSALVCRSRLIQYRCGPAQIRACLMYTHSCRAHAFASAGTIQISCCNECAICKSCRPHVRIRSVFTTHPPWQQQLGTVRGAPSAPARLPLVPPGLPLCIWTGFLGLESSHGCAHPLLGAHR